jgi:hypothetical protein
MGVVFPIRAAASFLVVIAACIGVHLSIRPFTDVECNSLEDFVLFTIAVIAASALLLFAPTTAGRPVPSWMVAAATVIDIGFMIWGALMVFLVLAVSVRVVLFEEDQKRVEKQWQKNKKYFDNIFQPATAHVLFPDDGEEDAHSESGIAAQVAAMMKESALLLDSEFDDAAAVLNRKE